MYQNATAIARISPRRTRRPNAPATQLTRCLPELLEVDDQQQQLRADQRRDDDVDAQVEDARGVEPPTLRAAHRQPQAE
jgi:hypothetical protein